MGPGQPIEQPIGPAEPEQSLAELPTRTFTRQQPGEGPKTSSEDDDREGPRPDQASDPRWAVAIRARGTGTPINRGDPGTGAIATTTGGTTGSAEYARNATGGTNGTTQAGTRQGTTRVRRSSVHAEVAITEEPSTDLEVNGPRWDDHVVTSYLSQTWRPERGRDSCIKQAIE